MEELFKKPIKDEIYYQSDNQLLLMGDSFELLKKLRTESVDLVFADPPYFLSNGGVSNSGGRMVSVNKGDWDKGVTLKEKHAFNKKWLRIVKRVLKPNGTIFVSGTFHNIYSLGMALEETGYKILNNITWQKTNPPPNLSTRYFTHSTETILWARKDDKKSRHYFNYPLMKELNGDKQMKDVWTGGLTKPSEKTQGKHPTQKPKYLLERIILASTEEGDIILDPFTGSGTTNVVAKELNRMSIGIDNEENYLEIAKKRLEFVE
ncbi:site-specific DNA-methyltransferase [Bacillus sp. AFS096315]|uniref:DNA-methyltransferase n=1 Tax=Bacillus sp. AFS096315 TaxID=2033517 RepID=UPI0025709D49|nr:site-specific DNA-methyltransferase [Bacillus sp. AFS096315]